MVEGSAAVGRRPLGALLIEAGVASKDEIRDALDECIRTRERLAEVVVRRGWISERKLAKLLADQNPGGTSVKKHSPVDLVGAWFRLTNNEDAHIRDVPDEAPLDDVNLEGEPMDTTEELHEARRPNGHEPTYQTFPGTDSVIERLHSLTTVAETLEHELAEKRQELEAQETELAELRQAHASDLDTISGLGAGLDERSRRLDALRAALGNLAVEFEK